MLVEKYYYTLFLIMEFKKIFNCFFFGGGSLQPKLQTFNLCQREEWLQRKQAYTNVLS